MTIAIISDTDTSLPQYSLDEYGIRQVSITIHFGEEILRACSDITDEELVARVNRDKILPTTAAPSPGDFSEAYKEAFVNGADEITCLTVSGDVSATYQAAIAAKDLHADRKITVVDTKSISMGQGFMVLKAAELAKEGRTKDDILAAVENVRDRTHLFAALETSKFMAMSGRVGHLTAEMANVLSIKPILTIKNGKPLLIRKGQDQEKSLEQGC